MRSNSGKDESRNNMRDPTMRDRTQQAAKDSSASKVSHGKAAPDHRGSRKG
jgi:hypothetical protein